MQPLTRCWVLLSLLAFLCTGFAPGLAAQTSTVRCEAPGRSQTQCPIPSNAQVRLARTLSQEACREGHNWGVGTSFIWVNGGCRAEFAVTSTGYETGPGYAPPTRTSSGPAGARRTAGWRPIPTTRSRSKPIPGRATWPTSVVGRPDERALRGGRQRPSAPVHQQPRRHRRRHHARRLRIPLRPGRVPDPGRRQDPAPPPDRPAALPPQRHLRAGRRVHLGGQGVPRRVRGRDGGRRGRRVRPGGLRLVAQHAPAVRDSARRAGAARPPDERGAVPHGPELGCRAGLPLGDPRMQRGVRGDGPAAEGKAATAGARASGGSCASPVRPRARYARSSAPPPSGWSSS